MACHSPMPTGRSFGARGRIRGRGVGGEVDSLISQKPRAESGQFQVMVGRQAFVGHELVRWADRNVIGAFENGRGLVHLVEHGHREHLGAGLLRRDELRPEKPAPEPRYLVKGRALYVEPAEPWKGDGEIVEPVFTTLGDIGLPRVGSIVL